ncbi:hypothetical protein C4K38_3556 [Pseudomonas chlororaphis subsp. piscium]|nr:hypothetical protein C4K38_3556 [Pseudomonas chlororaphis subsp. piscium]
MRFFTALIPFTILAISIGLGFFKGNWFLEFGMVIVAISALTSIVLAYCGGKKAALAEKVNFDSYLPDIDETESHSFKFTAGMMGGDPRNPAKHLQDQIDEIKKVAAMDEKVFRQGLRFAESRINICLAQIRYHEEVTLPKILGQGSGVIILSSALTIIGSAYLAFPVWLYNTFSLVANVLRGMFPVV